MHLLYDTRKRTVLDIAPPRALIRVERTTSFLPPFAVLALLSNNRLPLLRTTTYNSDECDRKPSTAQAERDGAATAAHYGDGISTNVPSLLFDIIPAAASSLCCAKPCAASTKETENKADQL